MIPLRANTASQEVLLGHFVDDTDGKTPETGLTIANTDIKLHKAGATSEANKNSGGATHIAGGRYYAVLDATDTDTVGPLAISCIMSGALPVGPLRCVVYPEHIYDALIAGTDYLEAHPGKFTVSTGTATLYKRDGSTPQGTRTLTSDGAAEPITGAS